MSVLGIVVLVALLSLLLLHGKALFPKYTLYFLLRAFSWTLTIGLFLF